jgi:F-type H+-transporting ATPase subunit c
MRKLGTVALWTLAFLLLPMFAGAQEVVEVVKDTNSWGYALGAGIAIGFGALGCGIGQGLTAGNTTAGIARNPGAAGSMFTNFILGMVLIESISIYALVVGLLLVFRVP